MAKVKYNTRRTLRHLPALTLFLFFAFWTAYPLWVLPGARLEDLGDPMLNSWILAWDHYALFHQLDDFFQANVFWPRADSLAYGEHMLTQAVLALPFRLITSHPAAIHNLSLIQGYFFCAVAAYLLGLHYFRRIGPAALCGLAYGFAAYRVNQGSHIQLVHGEFLPLMVLGLERLLEGGGRRWCWVLGLAALGQWLASWYWAVFSFWSFAPYLVVRLWQRRTRINAARAVSVFLPLLIAAACTLPAALPYLRLYREHAMIRPPETTVQFVARPADYLIPTRRSLLYHELNRAGQTKAGMERAMFPGILLVVGFLVAVLRRLGVPALTGIRPKGGTREQARDRNRDQAIPNFAFRKPHFPRALWIGITLVLISFTFGAEAGWNSGGVRHAIPLPLALLRWFPLADQMRVPARWMLPALLGLALLAADSWAALAGYSRGPALAPRRLVAGAAFFLFAAECLTRPDSFAPVAAQCPPAITWLNAQPYPSPAVFIPLEYEGLMLEAAWLRQPLVNGTNGYFPQGHFAAFRAALQDFPQPASVDSLRRLGVRFAVLNLDQARVPHPGWDPARLPRIEASIPQNIPTHRIGPYLILDLAPAATDPAEIGGYYNQLIERTLQTMLRHSLDPS